MLLRQVTGPARDVHSGNEGGVFSEPLTNLMHVLGQLTDEQNISKIPGFYSDMRTDTLHPALQRLDASSEFSVSGYQATLGVPQLLNNSTIE